MRRYKRLTTIAKGRGLTVEQLLTTEIETHGSILRAAQHLDLSPNTVRYQLERYGLTVIQVTKVVKAHEQI